MLYQKQIEPFKVSHNTMKNLVKKVISPRIISNMERLEALERSSSNSKMAFGTNNGFAPINNVSRLDNRMKVLEQEVGIAKQMGK